MRFVCNAVAERYMLLVVNGIEPFCLVNDQAGAPVSHSVTSECGRTVRVGSRFGHLFPARLGDVVCDDCASAVAQCESRP